MEGSLDDTPADTVEKIEPSDQLPLASISMADDPMEPPYAFGQSQPPKTPPVSVNTQGRNLVDLIRQHHDEQSS
jgi:hypothetical protein